MAMPITVTNTAETIAITAVVCTAARIFERFHRVDPARAAETGGAGLGLAIVRRIARLHGGEVALTSAKPRGCRFDFSIPM